MYPISGRPAGFQQITALSASTALTVPAGATQALIAVAGQTVRMRSDGVAPTTSVGFPLPVATQIMFTGNLSTLRFIEAVSGGIIDVLYFR